MPWARTSKSAIRRVKGCRVTSGITSNEKPDEFSDSAWALRPQCPPYKCLRPSRLDHVLEIPQPRARGVDQHRHVAGFVAVGAHQLVGVGDFLPGKHVAHARIDALVEHELVGGAGLLQVRE